MVIAVGGLFVLTGSTGGGSGSGGGSAEVRLRDPIDRNGYGPQSMSKEGEESEEEVESDKEVEVTQGAEPRRPGRLRKRAQVSTERRIIDEHWHDMVAHALLTVGSGGPGEAAAVVNNILLPAWRRLC